MVRIINDKEAPVAKEEVLSERSNVLLQMLSIVLVEQPLAIQNLLEEYQIELPSQPTDKERTEKLLSAVAACDHRFNTELAKIILDCTLESEYDSFNIKGLFKKEGSDSEESTSSSSGNGGGGIWAGIANAVGGVGGAIGQVVKGRQAKDQATAQTLQGIYNYRAQVAAQEKSKGKNKTVMVISILVLVALVIGVIAYSKRNQAPVQKT